MRTLTIPIKAVYFDQIQAGEKSEEYRLRTPYWCKRLNGRVYDQIVLTKGYPHADDAERRMTMPYRGFEFKTITHPHFGVGLVEVFAIRVGQA